MKTFGYAVVHQHNLVHKQTETCKHMNDTANACVDVTHVHCVHLGLPSIQLVGAGRGDLQSRACGRAPHYCVLSSLQS